MKKNKKIIKRKKVLKAPSGKSAIAIIFIVLSIAFVIFYIAGEQPKGIKEPQDYIIQSDSSLTPGHSLQINGFRLISPTPTPTFTPTPSPTHAPVPTSSFPPPTYPESEECKPAVCKIPPEGCHYVKDPGSCGCGALSCPDTPPPTRQPTMPSNPPPAL